MLAALDVPVIRVLHLTPHLGGGVGKALSSLCLQAQACGSPIQHEIVCLEAPEKTLFLQRILDGGGTVHVLPDTGMLARLVESADIVHLDWWNHPALFLTLCGQALPPHRLMFWSHVSGLFAPYMPEALVRAAHRCVFTSPCSLEAPNLRQLFAQAPDKTAVVSSGCGLETLPEPPARAGGGVRAGYVGSLNFAKLHPDYVAYLAAVDLPGFTVDLIGDTLNREELLRQCQQCGRPELLNFLGFNPDIPAALAQLDVLIYLLHPQHYGTAENALIEAMAMGVIPIVLDNPAEREIVADGVNGIVVRTPADLATALSRLARSPDLRRALSGAATRMARQRYTSERMEAGLASVYLSMLDLPRQSLDYSALFGPEPADWFLACQGESFPLATDGRVDAAVGARNTMLFERTKGSVFHFRDHFPADVRLAAWARQLGGA